jgi:general secretion pathway protein C
MRLRRPPRAGRLFRRLPRLGALSALELLLLALIAVQAARLAWTLVTPVGPVGDWRPAGAPVLPASDSALADFDPFFRLSAGAGPAAVTALNLKLYGVREDRATGRGSAIIALPDGTQRSFAVGEEIMAGVTLAQVGFDSVTINHGGGAEQIFLDQSRSPQATAPPAPAPGAAVPPNSQIRLQPAMRGGRVRGITVSPGIDGGYALRAAGLMPGDVIVSINGRAVTSVDDVQTLVRRAGGEASVIVERGGRTVPLQVTLDL